MIGFAICLLLSILLSLGIAVSLVEKGREWPIRRYNILIRYYLHKIHWKAPFALYCVTCTSFWVTLISDIVICILAACFGQFYFFWPFSGFVTTGISWFFSEFLNGLNSTPNITNNNYIIPASENQKIT